MSYLKKNEKPVLGTIDNQMDFMIFCSQKHVWKI